MAKPALSAVLTHLYELLEPLDTSERRRAVRAAFALLGEESVDLEPESAGVVTGQQHGGTSLPQKAQTWMRGNSISMEQLNQVFHIEKDKVEIIAAHSPGASVKIQTVNAYVLTGLRALLQSGEARFDDKSAREVCRSLGCYDQTNHATYLKGKGNALSGSKDSGWTLTGPGQTTGAALVKTIAGA